MATRLGVVGEMHAHRAVRVKSGRLGLEKSRPRGVHRGATAHGSGDTPLRRDWLLALTLVLSGLSPAEATQPAVARPALRSGAQAPQSARGVAFMLSVDSAPGVAAVGTAHTLRLEEIARAGQVDFLLGETQLVAASSQRFLVPPGQPFGIPNHPLRADFMVFALDAPPEGLRALEAAREPPEPGQRVRLWGISGKRGRHQDELFGRVERADATRLEVLLDVPHTLEGWGGAPILAADSDRVLGILEAQDSVPGFTKVIAAPISAVLAALDEPLGSGRGEAFSTFATDITGRPSVEPGSLEQALGLGEPRPPQSAAQGESKAAANLTLAIDYPAPGAVLAQSTCGVFVSGRASALPGTLRPFEVMLVIDTSRSTEEPSGADIDGDGRIGGRPFASLDFFFLRLALDPGDSILAAEIAAARQLVGRLDPRQTRIGLVAFSGGTGQGHSRRAPAATTLEPLTQDYARVEAALDSLLDTAPEGSTHMAAGLDQATTELRGLRGASSRPDPEAEKLVLFFTDGQPTLPHGPDAMLDNVRAVLRAADRAERAGVRVHSFAIGPEALAGPIAAVEMARRTRGSFTPVRSPGDLVRAAEDVELASIEEVTLWNETRREAARFLWLGGDGSWAGLVDLAPGRNRLRVRARAGDGGEAERFIEVHFAPEAPSPSLPGEFAMPHTRLLEDCLEQARGLRLEAEQQRAKQIKRKLRLEIEAERARAAQRADQQRKQLELEPARGGADLE